MAAVETELGEMRAFVDEEILPAVDLVVHDVEHEITGVLRVWKGLPHVRATEDGYFFFPLSWLRIPFHSWRCGV